MSQWICLQPTRLLPINKESFDCQGGWEGEMKEIKKNSRKRAESRKDECTVN